MKDKRKFDLLFEQIMEGFKTTSDYQEVPSGYDEDEEEPETQYAILDIETEEIEEFGDDPVQLMEIIDANEKDGTWEENKYGVFERQGETGEWEISEVIGTADGGWR